MTDPRNQLRSTGSGASREVGDNGQGTAHAGHQPVPIELAEELVGLFTWRVSAASATVTMSSNVERVLGFSLPDDTGEMLAAVYPDDRLRVTAAFERAMLGDGDELDVEFRFVAPRDGEIVWVRARGRRERDADDSLVGVTQNITERKQRELDAAFLVRLGDAIRSQPDPTLVEREATRLLGEHLGASRVVYAEYLQGGIVHPGPKYVDGVESLSGPLRIDDFDRSSEARLKAGQVIVDSDVFDDPSIDAEQRARFDAAGIRARVAVPLIRAGRLRGVLAVHQAAPHSWRGHEVAIVREAAERMWLTLEQVRSERALRESEQRYRTLFESMDAGFCVVEVLFDDNDGVVDYRFLELNPAFEGQTGLRDAVGRTATELVPHLESHWFETYGRVARTGEPVRFVDEASAMDGRWFNVNAFRLGAPEDRQVAILFTDITERKRAEEERERLLRELTRERGRLAEIVEQAPSLMTVYRGPDHVFEVANRYVREWYGRRDIIGKPVREALADLDVGDYYDMLDRVYRTGETFTETGAPVAPQVQPPGGRYVDVVYQPLRDADGAVTGVIGQEVDVTERVRAETALRDTEERQAFLLNLIDALLPLSSATDIEREATRMLGEALDTNRVFYASIEADGDTGVIRSDYANGIPSGVGRYSISAFASEFVREWRAGRTAMTSDVSVDPRFTDAERAAYASVSARAAVGVPLVKAGRLVALIGINHSTPRVWTDQEISLISEVSFRIREAAERARAEEALQASEEQYHTLFESIDEGFCIIEVLFNERATAVDYRFLEVNPAFEQQSGLCGARGKSMRELAPEHEQRWFDVYGRVATTGEPARFVDEAKALDGRWFDVHAFPVGEPGQRHVAVLFTDITKAKRAEDALRMSEERMRRALEIDTVGVIFFEPDGPISFANDAFLRMSGYTRDDVAGGLVRWDRITPSEWMAQSRRAREEFMTEGRSTPFEKEYIRKDGSRWWVMSTTSRIGDNEGVQFLVDITESKRAEAERDRLAAIVQYSRDAVLGIDLDGTITDWNPAAEALFGYAAAEAVGQPLLLLVPPERADDVPDTIERVRRGLPMEPFETERLRKDGSLVEVEVQPSAVRDAAGRVIGVASIVRDVTERKRLARVQDDFLAMVSHDLRSPVTVLRGRAQLMNRRKAYDEGGVMAILEQSQRIERMVDDLQDLVRMESGTVELACEELSLDALVGGAVERLRAGGSTHAIVVDVPDTPVAGRWDPDRLNQVLDNLLGNAAKYSPEDGEITVRVEQVDGNARVSIMDQGPGIPSRQMGHLFERFYRAGRDRSSPGLGLGLYISRMLVEAHGGRIWARSSRGAGSTFTFSIPMHGCDTSDAGSGGAP